MVSLQQKINNFIKKDYKSSRLACGFLINSYRFGLVPTFQDSFETYADQASADASWVPVDSTKARVNITNDNLDFNFIMDSTNDTISYDLSTVSDTAWVLRFKMRFSTLESSANNNIHIGISSVVGAGTGTAQDFIGTSIFFSGSKDYRALDTDGAHRDSGADASSPTYAFLISTDYYVEIKRLSAISYTIQVFTGSDYTTGSLGLVTGVCVATTSTLRYLTVSNYNILTEATGNFVGTIDDIKFYNGITTIP